MGDKTTINGWSIREGDYSFNSDYNELYKKAEKMKRLNKGLIIASATMSLIIITILSMLL